MSVERAQGQWALKAHAASEWLWWVMQVQLLWLLLTALGGVVLGVAPATVAVMAATRARLQGDGGPLWAPALGRWRDEFVRANAVLLPVLLVAALLAAQLVPGYGPTGAVHRFVVLLAAVLAVAVLSVLAPLYVHYDLPTARYLPTATRWALLNPAPVALLVLVPVLVWGLTSVLPGLLPFVSFGAWLVLDVTLCLAFFQANDKRIAEGLPPDGP